MSTGARLDSTQLWVPSRVPPSLGTQSSDPACWTLEPGSQRQRDSQMARELQSVLKGAFHHSLSDRVEKGPRSRSLERAWDKFVSCRHPQLWSRTVCRKPREVKRHEDPRWGLQGRWQSLCSWRRDLDPCPLSKFFPPASEGPSHLKPCMLKVPS